jgi:hypothetical protein
MDHPAKDAVGRLYPRRYPGVERQPVCGQNRAGGEILFGTSRSVAADERGEL